MTDPEEKEKDNLQPISTEEYFAAGVAGIIITMGSFFISLIFVLYVIKVSKEFENTLITITWSALSAMPLWFTGRYQVKREPRLGWKWGLWIALPSLFLMAVLTPFGNYPDMAILRVQITVGAVGTVISVLAAWFYDKN